MEQGQDPIDKQKMEAISLAAVVSSLDPASAAEDIAMILHLLTHYYYYTRNRKLEFRNHGQCRGEMK